LAVRGFYYTILFRAMPIAQRNQELAWNRVMARKGTAKARQILAEVMAEFGVDQVMMRTSGSRTEALCRAKEAFIVRCGEHRIQTVVMAEVLGFDRSVIWYSANPEVRARRNTLQNQRRKGKPRRSRAKVRVAAFMGQWS
jgi:hypothetical protein